jgi:hypothetical protein
MCRNSASEIRKSSCHGKVILKSLFRIDGVKLNKMHRAQPNTQAQSPFHNEMKSNIHNVILRIDEAIKLLEFLIYSFRFISYSQIAKYLMILITYFEAIDF